jgi:hypothetical protein
MRTESPYDIPQAAKDRISVLGLAAFRFLATILAKSVLPGVAIFGFTLMLGYASDQHLDASSLSAITHTMSGIAIGCARLFLGLIADD